ncbi:hypothetical protein BIY24_14860 [Halobacteriovorax marinus]|uniref:O-antigen export ABC transporter, ATP-binding protein n=1 Tax=Halobacteriovorax marinus (strain ATCC BAA-682 / DSM 15412 / SJ) TaxID=862908 RepID=E1WZW2_HALMS|nr:ATP-binding cassette domain-containing protein [Halobacteriovorax marinus]ATH09178.1 hypothetical protein BIY24_14860 [Halobacteriovorax marinus]CBW27898.1 putative O-antigen export ABC transporter, ATP-binding protein [Halobacteriovorax marinus SJ]
MLNSDEILEVSGLNMTYDTQSFHNSSLREVFIKRLTLQSTTKNTIHVLRGLDFKVHKGDIIGILGVNGTGKTTLCRIISGILEPSSGEVKLKGECRSIFNTTVGVLPELTGRENASLLVKFIYPKVSVKEQREILEDALEFSELGEFLDTPFQKYSKGMQARLCLSVISARPSDLIILDEVFDGADLFFQEKIRKRITEVIKSSGATILVSHTLDQIRDVCNKVMLLDKGKIQFFGDVEKGIKAYRFLDTGVASFRGEL